MTIKIRNRLEVLLGAKVLVPGCEPTSAFTSTTLAENRECGASVVDLADALEAIPGSTVQAQVNPRRLFFVLPEGPPARFGCRDTSKITDFYQILRDIGIPVEEEEEQRDDLSEICQSFSFKGCI